MAAVSDQLPNTIDLQLLDNQGNPESGFVRLAEGHPGALLAQGPASSLLGLVAGLKHAGERRRLRRGRLRTCTQWRFV